MLAALLVAPTHTGTETLAIGLRWVHFIAGITWIGLLYFFNLINVPFMKKVDASMKPKIFENLTLPALNLFRWSAMLTVFVGFWYWSQVYVSAAAHRENASAGGTILLFIAVWTIAAMILYPIIMKTPKPWLLAVIVIVVVYAAGWAFLRFVQVGRDDNHVLAIGIGGGLGWIMLFNVWGLIWPNQKKILGLKPATDEEKAKARKVALYASRTNFILSFPMLLCMISAGHGLPF